MDSFQELIKENSFTSYSGSKLDSCKLYLEYVLKFYTVKLKN